MKPLERDLDLISVIEADAQTLRSRIDRFQLDEERFVYDRSEEGELAFDAVMSPVYRIAEDALHLSAEVVDRLPELPWREIRGFRNFVAHGYREIDRRIAWEVATRDIPLLAAELSRYREAAGGDSAS
ncbi:MAG: DUF86 domain-containing protein [Eggerthellaceae bacterium]|nr:DUF86 domain-containing protein [Eggerthellaceae bacterium]